jgi:hypothetical protein
MNGMAVFRREAVSRSLSRQTPQFVPAPKVHTQPLPLATAQFTIQQFNDSTIPILKPPPKSHFKILTGLVTGFLLAFDSGNALRTRHLRKLTGFDSYFFVMPPFTTCHLPFRFAPSLPFAICHLPFRSQRLRVSASSPGGPVKARETPCESFLKGLCDLENFGYEPLAKIESF